MGISPVHTKPGLPTPAAGMIPPRGFLVSLIHSRVDLTTEAMLSVSVTSHRKKRMEDPSSLTRAAPVSSFISRTAALPPDLTMSRTQARPRPEALEAVVSPKEPTRLEDVMSSLLNVPARDNKCPSVNDHLEYQLLTQDCLGKETVQVTCVAKAHDNMQDKRIST